LYAQEHAARWSTEGRLFDLLCEHHCESVQVKSPDGAYSVGFDYSAGDTARVVVLRGDAWVGDLDLSAWQVAEILWSPGSRAFSIIGDEGEHPPTVRVWKLEAMGAQEVNLQRSTINHRTIQATWSGPRVLVLRFDRSILRMHVFAK